MNNNTTIILHNPQLLSLAFLIWPLPLPSPLPSSSLSLTPVATAGIDPCFYHVRRDYSLLQRALRTFLALPSIPASLQPLSSATCHHTQHTFGGAITNMVSTRAKTGTSVRKTAKVTESSEPLAKQTTRVKTINMSKLEREVADLLAKPRTAHQLKELAKASKDIMTEPFAALKAKRPSRNGTSAPAQPVADRRTKKARTLRKNGAHKQAPVDIEDAEPLFAKISESDQTPTLWVRWTAEDRSWYLSNKYTKYKSVLGKRPHRSEVEDVHGRSDEEEPLASRRKTHKTVQDLQ